MQAVVLLLVEVELERLETLLLQRSLQIQPIPLTAQAQVVVETAVQVSPLLQRLLPHHPHLLQALRHTQ